MSDLMVCILVQRRGHAPSLHCLYGIIFLTLFGMNSVFSLLKMDGQLLAQVFVSVHHIGENDVEYG